MKNLALIITLVTLFACNQEAFDVPVSAEIDPAQDYYNKITTNDTWYQEKSGIKNEFSTCSVIISFSVNKTFKTSGIRDIYFPEEGYYKIELSENDLGKNGNPIATLYFFDNPEQLFSTHSFVIVELRLGNRGPGLYTGEDHLEITSNKHGNRRMILN